MRSMLVLSLIANAVLLLTSLRFKQRADEAVERAICLRVDGLPDKPDGVACRYEDIGKAEIYLLYRKATVVSLEDNEDE